jgi:serine/threonine-protein kinase
VAAVLDFLASYLLIHRDLSPSNILIDAAGRVKVIDLGLARDAESALTRSSVGARGTPGYEAPEQLVRTKAAEPASDQWALAAIVYETLTGTAPYFDAADGADAGLAALNRIADDAPLRSPRELNPSVGEALSNTVLRALARVPRKRFPTSKVFVEELGRSPARRVKLPYRR